MESPASSCVSSDAEEEVPETAKPMVAVVGCPQSTVVPASSCVSSLVPERPAKPMVVVGCPQCLMYVMLSGEEQQPRCPRCKSPVLLHFLDAEDDETAARSRPAAGASFFLA